MRCISRAKWDRTAVPDCHLLQQWLRSPLNNPLRPCHNALSAVSQPQQNCHLDHNPMLSHIFKNFFFLISNLLSHIGFLSRLLMSPYISPRSLDALLLRSIKAFVMASAKCIRAQRQKGGPDALLSALAVPDAKPDSSNSAIAALPLTKI